MLNADRAILVLINPRMESKREFYIPVGVSRSAHVQTMFCRETNSHVTRSHGLNSVEPSVLITLLRVEDQ